MFSSLKLHLPNPSPKLHLAGTLAGDFSVHRTSSLRPPSRRFSIASLQLNNASSEFELTSAIGASPSVQLSQFKFSQRHILLLNFVACATAVSATCLFCSAIPAILAFKRAAESLEKLLDVTREELPITMAAVRLSGMEISDLTMELSDLGQEITQGVRSSTRAVRVAEERLRRLTKMPPSVTVQVENLKTETTGPLVARTARGLKDGIVKGRAILQVFLTIVGFSRNAFKYFIKKAK